MVNTETQKIKPAARLISTIGEDLVGDAYAAVVELVKNSYDADATKVDIIFQYEVNENVSFLNIEITDDGHGMTKSDVLSKWLVPATRDKLERKTSRNGRHLQGRKGIGRYAAAVLGQELIMKTVDNNKNETEVYIDWTLFDKYEYLDQVDIIVSTQEVNKLSGTSLYITAKGNKISQWGENEIATLTKELRKLKSPFNLRDDTFSINLAFINSPFVKYNDEVFDIEAFPVIDLYDYRIFGKINDQGVLEAKYENRSEPNLPSDDISIKIQVPNASYCGPIDFDFRVFDRDPQAISNLIDKGLIDPISKLAIGKNEAKRMLDDVYGVNLYREGFRIRPYGNGGIDWLNLDKDRIQNPSVRISNNQIVGFVNIKPEEISHLEEKSARDGLKETIYYKALVLQLREALKELETRRFNYRKKVGKGRNSTNLQKELSQLFNYNDLAQEINKELNQLNVGQKTINAVTNVIQKEAEKKTKLLENIQNTIAIYQGQATLGKIVTVLLHEGRKPINYFTQQSPNLTRWLKYYKAKRDWDDDTYDDILDRLSNFKMHSDFLSDLFRRLDPLSKQNRSAPTEFKISNTIQKAKHIFENQLENENISFSVSCDNELGLKGWEEDLIIVLANLIENSIYWLNISENTNKNITVEVLKTPDIILHYKDNGPGIDKDTIEAGSLFEPGFSKKLNGTGLGLPIAGEAVERLSGSITAHHSENGAYFTIEFKK